MAVSCLLFGRYAELLGTAQLELELGQPATVADAVERLRGTHPHGDRLPPSPLVAVNREHVGHDRVLAHGDELAFLPPLAGG
jgi:molybdopterin converting factor small subunit